MPLESDLKLDYTKFDPRRTSEGSRRFLREHRKKEAEGDRILDKLQDTESISRERELRRKANKRRLDTGESFHITVANRDIPVRKFEPECGKSRGIFMHVHGGGWVFNDEDSHDEHIKMLADECALTVISIGYRLAPEHPHPCGADDCANMASYLATHGPSQFGSELAILGGESAGAHLALLAYRHLLSTHQAHTIRGLSLAFGCYDLSHLPYLRNPTPPQAQFADTMAWYTARLFGQERPDPAQLEDRRRGSVSPLYADWRGGHVGGLQNGWSNSNGNGNAAGESPAPRLAPALFACGSDDPLVMDSVFMAATWQMAGGRGVLRVYNGGWHGFVFHEESDGEMVSVAKAEMVRFVQEVMAEG